MNPDDVAREQILKFLYERHKTSRSISSIPIGIRDLQREMKERHGMKQQEVAHNLDYLIQVGWAAPVVKERDFTTPRGMKLSREQEKFKISDVGINHLESATLFSKPRAAGQINITTIQGVTIVGDGNVVKTELADLSLALEDLDASILDNEELTPDQKLDASADIATIRNQLAKSTPDKSIVQKAWDSIKMVGAIASLAKSFAAVVPIIEGFLKR
jgi:hypothetical protein